MNRLGASSPTKSAGSPKRRRISYVVDVRENESTNPATIGDALVDDVVWTVAVVQLLLSSFPDG